MPANRNQDRDTSTGFWLADTWHVQPKLNRIRCGDEQVRIPDKFMQVLVYLAERGDVVSRDELMKRVWPDTFVVEESLTRAISELRKVFGDSSREPRIIETIPKKGYRLIAPVAWNAEPPQTAPGPRTVWLPRILISAALLVAVGSTLLLWHERQAPTPRSEPRSWQVTSLQGREVHPALSRDGRRLAFVWSGADSLGTAIMVTTIEGDHPIRLTPSGGNYSSPAWSPDARRLAFVRRAPAPAGICLISAQGGAEELVVPTHHLRPPTMPDFSPDGQWLAFTEEVWKNGPFSLFLYAIETGHIRRITEHDDPTDFDYRPRFSPDGTRIAYIRIRADETRLAVMTLDGHLEKTYPPGDRQLIDFAWAPGGRALLFLANDGIWRQPLAGGAAQNIKPGVHLWQSSLAVARDVPLLVHPQADDERNIWLYDPDHLPTSSPPAAQLIGSSGYDARPAYSPDGRRIAFISNRSGTRQVWVADADGAAPRRLTDYAGCLVLDPAWSPDGKTLAFLAYPGGWANLNLIDIRTGTLQTIITSPSLDLEPSWSADGRSIYFTSDRTGEAGIWKIPVSGGPARPVTAGEGYRPRESRDGAWIYYRKTSPDSLGIWRQPVGGGVAERVFEPETGRLTDWCLGDNRIYFCRGLGVSDPVHDFGWFDVATHEDSILFAIESQLSPHMDVHPDGRRMIFDRTTRYEADLVAFQGF